MNRLILIIDKIKYKIEFSNKELFKEYSGYEYFLVVFNSEKNDFILGKPFFRKYPIVFNLENQIGKIGFYPNQLNLYDNDNSNNMIYFSSISYMYIGIGLINICLLLYIMLKYFKNNRKKRANELFDDNFEYSSIEK